jgi:hypothetical protein
MKLRLFIANDWTTAQWISTLRTINAFYISYLKPEVVYAEVEYDSWRASSSLIEEIARRKARYFYEARMCNDADECYFRALEKAHEDYQLIRAELAEDVIPLDSKLIVTSVNFNSPGFQDLSGVGEALKQIKELILGLLEYHRKGKLNELEKERFELENERIRIENEKTALN